MVQLQSQLDSLKQAGIQVLAVSYDPVPVLKRFADRRGIRFPLLSDPGSRTIDTWQVRNREAAGSRIDGVPYPGTFLIDRDGVIRAKLFYEGYKQRHHAEDILEAWKKVATGTAAAGRD
ncbi:MAG: DUF899 domain-containing protein [Verrucomicrobia bacterium]|nr:MAG: DUF899 domain-containing protein [Verrucomicrobiota bacterium]